MTTTLTYLRTHSATFISDHLRNLLKILVVQYKLDAQKILDAWTGPLDLAVRTWLESGHLTEVILEFYLPGSTEAEARWDFPINYSVKDVDEMWTDRDFLRESIAKAKPVPAGCSFRVVVRHTSGAPPVEGMVVTSLRSTDGLTAREAGTVIATSDITASARYYRK